MFIHYVIRDGVAIITMSGPPVNALNEELRAATVEAVHRAESDPRASGVVLRGSAKIFSAGADITEFDGLPKRTTVRDMVAVLSQSSKPVVAALTGVVYGGGLEIAFGAHYRVATVDAKLALPEVRLGLVPGAGGTQAIVRTMPATAALTFVSEGIPWSATRIWATDGQTLIDSITETAEDCERVAIDRALRAAKEGTRPMITERPLPEANPEEFEQAAAAVRRRSRGAEAPLACLELVSMALDGMPIETGLAREAELFTKLQAGPESHAMRHVFFAERKAANIDNISADVAPVPVDQVGVIGAGTMGVGIAICFLASGYQVTLVDSDQFARDRAKKSAVHHFEEQQRKGRIELKHAKAALEALVVTSDFAAIRNADAVIEAVFEDIDVKRDVLRRVAGVVGESTVIASNTSTLDIDDLATTLPNSGRVIGMHFFSPAPVMPLLEVVRGRTTSGPTLKTALQIAKRIGKVPVVAGVCDGFIGNRLLAKYRDAAMGALWDGASPSQVDSAVEDFGFAMGPFRMSDMAGNDIGWAVRKRRYQEFPKTPRDLISDALCEAGRFGQKSGAGWYDYVGTSRAGTRSPQVDEMIDRMRKEHGKETRQLSPESIVDRLLAALVDEGYRVVDDGIAQRVSDIDVVYVNGYGFPRHRGGPMYYANETWGIDHVLATLREANGPHWQPARGLVASAMNEEEQA